MKALILFSLLIFGLTHAQAEIPVVDGAKVFCDHDFKDGIVIVDKTYKIDDCAADVVWGFENVCYVGDAQELADRINNKEFRWKVGFAMSLAEVAADGTTVEFNGHDWLMSGTKDITPCEESFFTDKDILNPEKL